MSDLKTTLGSLELQNPVIVSSGYVTETESAIRRADECGPGAIVLKTALPDTEYAEVVKPWAPRRYPSLRAKFDSCEDGLLGAESLSTMPLELWAEWLAGKRGLFQSPIIASVAAVSPEGHAHGAKMMEEAGADALEILLACPAPYFKRFDYAMTQDARIVKEVCEAVRESVAIPVGVKIMPFSFLARAAREAGVDWITFGGVFLAAPGVNLETLEPEIPCGVFISGSRLYKYVTCRALLSVSSMTGAVHFSAHGGVQSWREVAEFILYGARSAQAQSVFMLKGIGVLEEMKRGLGEYMDRKGFADIEAMRGAIVPKVLTFDEMLAFYPETKGKIIARVEESLCNGCGLCEEVCIFDSINLKEVSASVDNELCEGCRLCVSVCPAGAVELLNVSLMRKKGEVP